MIPAFFERLFGPSWKSTLSSVIGWVGAFILFAHMGGFIKWPGSVLAFAMFLNGVGVLGHGHFTKDKNVTGVESR